jgi:alpha-amylase
MPSRASRFGRPLAVGLAVGLSLAGSGSASNSLLLATAPPRGAELRALSRPVVRPPLASQRIYFVMPDRYANGNPSNDRGGLAGSREVTGYDPTDTGYFHGGDYAGLTGDCTGPRGLARIKDLGFTSIWVTPPYRQRYVQDGSAGYHGYWGADFTTVDPHLGTDAEFGAFVDCAHRLGLRVILDVVPNHTADVISLPRLTYGPPQTPPAPPAIKQPAWLNDVANYHNRGNIDFNSCPPECLVLGDFFGLDDLATERQNVRDGLVELYADWIRRYKIDGFRIDTARHVEPSFFGSWVPRILAAARAAGVQDFQLFGEAFIRDAVELSSYVRDRGLPNVLDFPMQDAMARFAGGSAGSTGIAARLSDDDYFVSADGVTHVPPTFLGNHDVGRAAQQVLSLGAGSGGPLLQRTLLAYDLLYLLRGAPVVYYGDEFGIVGRGGDKEARQDLFPTQVAEWQTQERVGNGPVGTGSSFDLPENPIATRLRQLGRLRAENSVLSTGATIVRRTSRTTLAVSRIDAAGRREYLALFNAGGSPARLTIATATPQAEWTRLLGSTSPASSTRTGSLTLTVPAYSSAVLQATRQITAARAAKPALKVARDSLSSLVRVSATAGARPVTVSFAVRRAGRWTRIAADDSPPYRTFLDPAKFRRGERIDLVAIVRTLHGRTAVSAVRSYVPRR